MPYIKPEDRIRYGYIFDNGNPMFHSPGDLNYLITKLCLKYLGNKPNYQRYNEVMGVLECSKLEFYRRRVSPYEDEKIKTSGDV
jgi:hypothetical protein